MGGEITCIIGKRGSYILHICTYDIYHLANYIYVHNKGPNVINKAAMLINSHANI